MHKACDLRILGFCFLRVSCVLGSWVRLGLGLSGFRVFWGFGFSTLWVEGFRGVVFRGKILIRTSIWGLSNQNSVR